MTKKDILELRRRMKKEECTFTKMRGCYVDYQKNIILRMDETFLNLIDEEFFKYLEIAKKTISGTVGNNLLNPEFPPAEELAGGKQNFLLGLRDSGLKNDALLERLYELIIENYDYDGNYLILLFHDAYDVMTKTSDNNKLDESEEVYDYIICSICPVELTKAGLGYRKDENRIGVRIRDRIVGMPETGFVFPAFSDRSSDIHSLIYYSKNPKEPHSEFMENALGCNPKRTAAVEKKTFGEILKTAVADTEYDADEMVIEIHQALNNLVEENDTPTNRQPVELNSRTIENLVTNGAIPEDIANKLDAACAEEFGDEPPVLENIVDTKAIEKFYTENKEKELRKEVSTLKEMLKEANTAPENSDENNTDSKAPWDEDDLQSSIILRMNPEKAVQVTAQMVDGKRCIVIPLDDEQTVINGINTEL